MFPGGRAAAVAGLLACFLWLAWSGAARSSATFDEPFNILSARGLSAAGELPPGQAAPPLLLRWLSLSLPGGGALSPLDDAAYRDRTRSYGLRFIYSDRVPPARLLLGARAANLALGAALALLCGFWALRLGGPVAGLAALGVFAFMPPLLAHSALATTDIGNALLCTATAFLLWRGSRSPGPVWAAAAGGAAGLALAGKYTAALLVPLSLACLMLWGGARLRNICAWSAAAAAALSLGILPWSPADWLQRGMSVVAELSSGHVTYLLGEVSRSGTWYYFPLALLLKTPLPGLVLAAAGLFLPWSGDGGGREARKYLLLPAAAWLLLGLSSETQVGIRHLLPVYPLLCVGGGLAAARLWETGGVLRRGTLAVLMAWLAAGTLAASPWQISYFNEIARIGGGGHRFLLDSNLDWGQGLSELGDYARAKGAGHIYLSYFGCADPGAYGLKFSPVLMTTCGRLQGDGPPPPEGPQLLAVSLTNRLGVYYTPRGLFSWLDGRSYAPVGGGSIWVYDITGDPAALRLLSDPSVAR